MCQIHIILTPFVTEASLLRCAEMLIDLSMTYKGKGRKMLLRQDQARAGNEARASSSPIKFITIF